MNKLSLIAAFRQSYHNQRLIAQVYRAFAERARCETHQAIIRVLVKKAERSATVHASRLLKMGVLPPLDGDRLRDRWSRWFLLRCGLWWIMAWVEWVEKRDLHRYVRLFESYTQTQPSASRESFKTETFRQSLLKHYHSNARSKQ